MLALVLSLLPQQAPDQDTFTAWRDHLAPAATEDRWQQIPWQPSISQGIQQAAATNRPMLLWLMNGHPLGCT